MLQKLQLPLTARFFSGMKVQPYRAASNFPELTERILREHCGSKPYDDPQLNLIRSNPYIVGKLSPFRMDARHIPN